MNRAAKIAERFWQQSLIVADNSFANHYRDVKFMAVFPNKLTIFSSIQCYTMVLG